MCVRSWGSGWGMKYCFGCVEERSENPLSFTVGGTVLGLVGESALELRCKVFHFHASTMAMQNYYCYRNSELYDKAAQFHKRMNESNRKKVMQ
jgi:hypothetical protein